jgi:tetratricopeptide (TPR) repeat protein
VDFLVFMFSRKSCELSLTPLRCCHASWYAQSAAEQRFSTALDAWLKATAPPDETAALYKLRGNCRVPQGLYQVALQDYNQAIALLQEAEGRADPAELPDTLKQRARCEERLGQLRQAEQVRC